MTTEEREIWRNETRSTIYVLVNDISTPGVYQQVRLDQGDEIAITPAERKRNGDISVPEKDPFKTGFLAPVQLIESAADYERLQEEPNVKSESELIELLNLNTNKLKAELQRIDGFRVVQRMIELAEKEEIDVSVAKMKALQERLDEITPKVITELGDHTGDIRPQHLGNVRLNS